MDPRKQFEPNEVTLGNGGLPQNGAKWRGALLQTGQKKEANKNITPKKGEGQKSG